MNDRGEITSLFPGFFEWVWYGVGDGNPVAITLFACVGWLCYEIGRTIAGRLS